MMGEVIRVSGRAPNVGDLLREAMVSQRFADVALCCSGGQRFLAHRLVLSAASPYLQDVLLAHGKAAGHSEPITMILAEVEGPELSAILGFVYTGSATIPKSRLEAFNRAAETLRVTVPTLTVQSALVNCNYRLSSSSSSSSSASSSSSPLDDRIEDDFKRHDNVKIEETTKTATTTRMKNDTRYDRCEQYPSREAGWHESSNWHFHDACTKRDCQRDNENWHAARSHSPMFRRSFNDIATRRRDDRVPTRNDNPENQKYSHENPENQKYSHENPENQKYSHDNPENQKYSHENPENQKYSHENPENQKYSHDNPENIVRINFQCEKNEKTFFPNDKNQDSHYYELEARKKNYFHSKIIDPPAESWRINHSTILQSLNTIVEPSVFFNSPKKPENHEEQTIIGDFMKINDAAGLNSFVTLENEGNSLSGNCLESARGYETKIRNDNVVFEKHDCDVNLPVSMARSIGDDVTSNADTVVTGTKIISEIGLSSIVANEYPIGMRFVENSTNLRKNNVSWVADDCCNWRIPKRHVANRVPASPWCQLARPSHHSPKTRPIVLSNRDDSIETSSRPVWNDSAHSSEKPTNSYSPESMICNDARIDNSSSLPLNLNGNTNNDSSGSNRRPQVPKTMEISFINDENIDYIERSRSPRFYDDRQLKESSNFTATTNTTMEQLSSRIRSDVISRNTEESGSMIDEHPDQMVFRQIERASDIIANDEQTVIRISQGSSSPRPIDKRPINDSPTCNQQTTARIELSHPISRLCDTARINDEFNSREPFLIEKSTSSSSSSFAALKTIETKHANDDLSFNGKRIFSIADGILPSDDNNNNEAGIEDDSVVENLRNVDFTMRDENERIASDDVVVNNEEHRCDQCGKTFVTRASLKVHGRTHSGEKPFRCNDCGKEFSQLRNYKYHRSVHEGTREFAATCPECGKYFNDRGYLSSHMKIHRNRKEYACAECGKSFNQRVAYNMHVRIHTGLKPHQCDQCGKAFSRKMLLKQHLRTHSGERPYQCQICQKAFADRSNMTLHTRLHSGLKPYQCTLCAKAFTKKHHLKTHLNYHTGTKPYSCPNCSLRFSQSSNMRTHYKKCSSLAGNERTELHNDETKRESADKTRVTAPSGDGVGESSVVVAPSVGLRTNVLTPPNSDQESGIKSTSIIMTITGSRSREKNRETMNIPDGT